MSFQTKLIRPSFIFETQNKIFLIKSESSLKLHRQQCNWNVPRPRKVINNRIFIFGWTIPLIYHITEGLLRLHLCEQKYNKNSNIVKYLMKEWMKCICPCFTPSWIAFLEGARETVSLPRHTLSTSFFFLFVSSLCQETDFYVERVTAHRIKRNDHSCFPNRLPNSKTKLKLKHLWEQGGPLVFRGPTHLAYSAYREDRLCYWPF